MRAATSDTRCHDRKEIEARSIRHAGGEFVVAGDCRGATARQYVRHGAVRQAYDVLLGVLTLLFAARVFGRLLVAVFGIGSLPPMSVWYSGLIPYPARLPI